MKYLIALAAIMLPPSAVAQAPAAPPVTPALQQLRHVVGTWDVRTEFLNPDGSVARAADGSYEFEWVVPDKIVRGVSRIPAMDQVSAILFYVRPAKQEVEMVSVGGDGVLWVMTGKDNEEVRSTADRLMSDGSKMRLRFTRFDVQPDRFRSKMEWSTDGGNSWTPGNRQTFIRRN